MKSFLSFFAQYDIKNIEITKFRLSTPDFLSLILQYLVSPSIIEFSTSGVKNHQNSLFTQQLLLISCVF